VLSRPHLVPFTSCVQEATINSPMAAARIIPLRAMRHA